MANSVMVTADLEIPASNGGGGGRRANALGSRHTSARGAKRSLVPTLASFVLAGNLRSAPVAPNITQNGFSWLSYNLDMVHTGDQVATESCMDWSRVATFTAI